MTANEITSAVFHMTGSQVEGVLKDWPSDQWDARINDQTMSAKEVVAHLTECCLAFQKSAKGEQHEWGTYVPADTSVEGLLATMRAERAACGAMLASANDDQLKEAFMYIHTHDAYHVGQLVSLRLTLNPEWNSYAIYE